MDSGKAVAVTLLDLSAAFDTIDHIILFDCLSHHWFGIDGTVLMWIKPYHSNCRQEVKLGISFSDAFSFPYGVPKVLSWVRLYYPLSPTVSSFNVTHHRYADDTQIHLVLDSRNFDCSIAELTECLTYNQKLIETQLRETEKT